MRYLLIIMAAFFLTGCNKDIRAAMSTASGVETPLGPQIFVLAGQSNMSGRAVGPNRSNSSIRMLGNDYKLKVAADPIDDATGQTHMGSVDWTAGVGPGLFFAEALKARVPGIEIVLVPCAKGGTKLDQWLDQNLDSLMFECREKVKEAKRLTNGTVAGVLMYQGEDDATDPTLASTYAMRMTEWIKLAQRWFPDRPAVIYTQVATTTQPAYLTSWTELKAEQEKVIGGVMVRTDGLSVFDGIHLDYDSNNELGRRYAVAYVDNYL